MIFLGDPTHCAGWGRGREGAHHVFVNVSRNPHDGDGGGVVFFALI